MSDEGGGSYFTACWLPKTTAVAAQHLHVLASHAAPPYTPNCFHPARIPGASSMLRRLYVSTLLVVALVLAPTLHAGQPQPLQFQVTFDKSVSPAPFTGRVFVL